MRAKSRPSLLLGALGVLFAGCAETPDRPTPDAIFGVWATPLREARPVAYTFIAPDRCEIGAPGRKPAEIARWTIEEGSVVVARAKATERFQLFGAELRSAERTLVRL